MDIKQKWKNVFGVSTFCELFEKAPSECLGTSNTHDSAGRAIQSHDVDDWDTHHTPFLLEVIIVHYHASFA